MTAHLVAQPSFLPLQSPVFVLQQQAQTWWISPAQGLTQAWHPNPLLQRLS